VWWGRHRQRSDSGKVVLGRREETAKHQYNDCAASGDGVCVCVWRAWHACMRDVRAC
jgi:hypothetical protein